MNRFVTHSTLAAALTLCLVAPADAIIFDFSWSGDPTADATIISSDDATLQAIGTIEIDALPGSAFGLADIVATGIDVTGNTITDFMFNSWSSAAGSIAADGLSATFVGSAANEPFFGSGPAFFGCLFNLCDNPVIRARSGVTSEVTYASPDDALASMQMTASVPEPTTLALMGLGLAGLGYRRKKAA